MCFTGQARLRAAVFTRSKSWRSHQLPDYSIRRGKTVLHYHKVLSLVQVFEDPKEFQLSRKYTYSSSAKCERVVVSVTPERPDYREQLVNIVNVANEMLEIYCAAMAEYIYYLYLGRLMSSSFRS